MQGLSSGAHWPVAEVVFDGDSAAQARLRDRDRLDWTGRVCCRRETRDESARPGWAGWAGLGWARDLQWACWIGLDWRLAGDLGLSGLEWSSRGLAERSAYVAYGWSWSCRRRILLDGWDAGSRPLPRPARINTNRQSGLAGGGMQVPLSSVA